MRLLKIHASPYNLREETITEKIASRVFDGDALRLLIEFLQDSVNRPESSTVDSVIECNTSWSDAPPPDAIFSVIVPSPKQYNKDSYEFSAVAEEFFPNSVTNPDRFAGFVHVTKELQYCIPISNTLWSE